MRRIIAAALLYLSLLFSPPLAQATSDMGDPSITRIWASTDEGDRFVCTGTYIRPNIGDGTGLSWFVSAGHCTIGDMARRNANVHIIGGIRWVSTTTFHNDYGLGDTVDIALGLVPDVRDDHSHLWLAEKSPDEGLVYIHGFPEGVERVSIAQVLTKERASQITLYVPVNDFEREKKPVTELFPGTKFMITRKGEVHGGSSGSPVLNGEGDVVGILWGLISTDDPQAGIEGYPTDKFDLVLWTPIEKVHEAFRSMGVKE